MKNALLYGGAMALAGLALNILCDLIGWHNDAATLNQTSTIVSLVSLLIAVVGLTLGIRAARAAQAGPDGPYPYGAAVGSGLRIALVNAAGAAVLMVVYLLWINPQLQDLYVEAQQQKMAAKGLSEDQIAKAEGFTRFIFHPGVQFFFILIVGFLFGLVLTLIIAAFLRRPEKRAAAPVSVATP